MVIVVAVGKKRGLRFRPFFRHWRSGKILWAKDYGYKSWPFGGS